MIWNKYKIVRAVLLLLIVGSMENCGVYSFTGAATNAKTIQIETFFNNTDLGQANLGVNFTNGLKDYFRQNSSLVIAEENGDLYIDGSIINYSLSPQAPTNSADGISLASQTRLTIGIKVNYVDNLEEGNSFKDRNFSFYEQFDSDKDIESVEKELERKIFEQIYLDIFNATLANW